MQNQPDLLDVTNDHEVHTLHEMQQPGEVTTLTGVKSDTKTGRQISAQQDPEQQFILDINRAVLSGDITIDKINQLLDIKKRIIDQRNLDAFNAAMSLMQAELPVVGKDKVGDKNARYASYESLWGDCKEIVGKHGFSLTFDIDQTIEHKITVIGKLTHSQGHFVTTHLTLPLDTSGSKNAVQGYGSTLSYGKRYTATFLLNVASALEDDDDGVAAGKHLSAFVGQAELKTIHDGIKKCDDKYGDTKTTTMLLNYMNVPDFIEIPMSAFPKARGFLEARWKGAGTVNPTNAPGAR